jgi:hypothetical protein
VSIVLSGYNTSQVSQPTPRPTADRSSRQPRRDWSIVIAVAVAVVSAATAFPFTAKPVSWDEWVYMGLAFHPQPAGWVLNRFAHIYAMKPFMWLAGDPFVGARMYWCALIGITVGALVWAGLQLPARRGRVIALALFLLMGQETLFAFPGVPYADYAIMAVITVASCLVLGRIAHGADLSAFDAAALGLLFCLGFKAKEAVAPVLVLAGALFISPSGRLRSRATAQRLAFFWLAGAVAAMCGIIALDGLILHDALFSLRPSSWGQLLAFNTAPRSYGPSEYSWLRFMLQPESFASFALYLGAGLAWSSMQPDRRLLLVYALPALFLLMMAAGGMIVAAPVIPRYTIPILPLLSLLAALATAHVLSAKRQAQLRALVPWLGLLIVSLITAASMAARHADATGSEAWSAYVGPASLGIASAAFLLLGGKRLGAAIAAVAIVLSGSPALAHVVGSLARRDVQRQGEARFAGFYQVARALPIDRNDILFVSRNVYGGAMRQPLTASIARMSFNVPLERTPLTKDTWPAPPEADYAVVSLAEYEQWRTTPDARPERAVLSDDREVAVICLRGACPLR